MITLRTGTGTIYALAPGDRIAIYMATPSSGYAYRVKVVNHSTGRELILTSKACSLRQAEKVLDEIASRISHNLYYIDVGEIEATMCAAGRSNVRVAADAQTLDDATAGATDTAPVQPETSAYDD